MRDEIKKYWSEFKEGTKKMFKEFFKKETNKKQRANMWTFSRLIIPIITIISSTIAIITNFIPLLITASLFAGFGAVTDYFDGKSSRKHNSASEYGKLLDQITDKAFSGLIGINLLFINPNYIVIIFGELLIAITNIYYKTKYKNLNINSTKIGKIKQFPLFLSLSLGYISGVNSILNIISNVSITLTILIQLMTSYSYIINNNKEVQSMAQKKTNIVDPIEDYDKIKKKIKQLDTKINSNNLQKIKNKKKNLEDMKQILIESKIEKTHENNKQLKKSNQ